MFLRYIRRLLTTLWEYFCQEWKLAWKWRTLIS